MDMVLANQFFSSLTKLSNGPIVLCCVIGLVLAWGDDLTFNG